MFFGSRRGRGPRCARLGAWVAGCLALLGVGLAPQAKGEAREREGSVLVAPLVRFAHSGGDGRVAPGAIVAFGYRPELAWEIGIDIGASYAEAEDVLPRLVAMPLVLRGSYTPLPKLDLRPVVHAFAGKVWLQATDAAGTREHTPFTAGLALGLQLDLSERFGVAFDGGYQYAAARDSTAGKLEAGGSFARAGVYVRVDPAPKRRGP